MIGQLSSTLEDSWDTEFTLFPLVILSTNFWASYYRYFNLKKKKKDEKLGKKYVEAGVTGFNLTLNTICCQSLSLKEMYEQRSNPADHKGNQSAHHLSIKQFFTEMTHDSRSRSWPLAEKSIMVCLWIFSFISTSCFKSRSLKLGFTVALSEQY